MNVEILAVAKFKHCKIAVARKMIINVIAKTIRLFHYVSITPFETKSKKKTQNKSYHFGIDLRALQLPMLVAMQ